MRLSRLAIETNTLPLVGSEPNAAAWALANAVPKSASKPITSPVDFISGPSTVSTLLAVGGAEPVERHHRLLDRDRRVRRQVAAVALGGQQPSARSSAIVSPSITRAAALASGVAVALETNGTVRLARGLASST